MTMSDLAIDFEWDANKAASNLTKHGVTFEQAATVFIDALALTVFDEAHSDYEERWFTLGHTDSGNLLAVSHTYVATGPASARVRIISARPATKQERRYYMDEPR
jgi:uncharacterized DUF497 family protein